VPDFWHKPTPTMSEVPPLLVARLQELKATIDENLACMLRGGSASFAMKLRYVEHLELEMLKWQQFMTRPALLTADVPNVALMPDVVVVKTAITDAEISDISDDEDSTPPAAVATAVETAAALTAEGDTAVALTAEVDTVVALTAEVDTAVAFTAEVEAVALTAEVDTAVAFTTAMETAVVSTAAATETSAVLTDNDDDGENAQRDPYATPFTLLEMSAFDIAGLDMFLHSAVEATPALPLPLTLPLSPRTYPYAVYRFDAPMPPTPPPTPTLPATPMPPMMLTTMPTASATPKAKRHRNVLQVVNTGFSEVNSTVDLSSFPDFEDNFLPTRVGQLVLPTRAPPTYVPPKFDVIRLKQYMK
jgi:hypothetical protein